ncbi:peptidase S8/S53 domain-containing protein [Trametes maxima]|nr:peptidase S8/S53 domain-containing protein [Trametes maxima]
MQVHDVRASIHCTFSHVGPAPPDAMLDLRIALKTLMDVSTPGSPLYGQYLSKKEAFVAPKPESEAAAKKITPAGDWLAFSIPVSKASELTGTEFSVYNHTPTGKIFIRTLEYSILTDLKGHLNFVHPIIAFVQPFARHPFDIISPNATIPSSCESFITPQCLLDLYGIILRATSDSVFLDTFRPDLPVNTPFAFPSIDGGKNPQGTLDAGIEANIDIQYTVGIAAGALPTTFFSIDTNSIGGVGSFMDLAITMLSQESLSVIVTSSSFGFNENELTANVIGSLCNMYAHLGVLGLTFVFNSGDGGVVGGVSEGCASFVPTFPSSCPFVTSVGATTGIPEVAASFSSGGFSEVLDPLSFQEPSIERPLGRGFPDIATQGEDIEIVLRGVVGAVSGTGCCAPVVVFSLLNDELAGPGRPPLGFVNPLLYSLAGTAAFTDITNGSNPGCGTDGTRCVTGLGTPNYTALRSALGL